MNFIISIVLGFLLGFSYPYLLKIFQYFKYRKKRRSIGDVKKEKLYIDQEMTQKGSSDKASESWN